MDQLIMPIYEFRCNACHHRFSKLFRAVTSSSEGLKPPCPQCQSVDTMRLISSFAVHGAAHGDAAEAAADSAALAKPSAVTPREQIDRWRGAMEGDRGAKKGAG